MADSKPTTGIQIEDEYGISAGDFAALPLHQRALYRAAYAADVLHVQEEPHGSNDSPDIRRYLRMCGIHEPAPWCVAFVAAMLLDSGAVPSRLPDHPASVASWAEWAHDSGRVISTPVRACVGLLTSGGRSHGFWIAGPLTDGLHVRTIEGNSNDGGSREGFEVIRRVRPISGIDLIVSLGGIG